MSFFLKDILSKTLVKYKARYTKLKNESNDVLKDQSDTYARLLVYNQELQEFIKTVELDIMSSMDESSVKKVVNKNLNYKITQKTIINEDDIKIPILELKPLK